MKRNKESLWDLGDTINRSNLHILGLPEGRKREKGAENLFKEIMAENVPNLRRDLDIQVHEANRSYQNFNSKHLLQYTK